ncbi:MAG: type II/IV secretion system protein [Patescibacteria group bacterium]
MTSPLPDNSQAARLDEIREREAEDLAHILAERYKLPYIDLTKVSINTDALRLMPEASARLGGIALFSLSGRTVEAAVLSPRNEHLPPILHELEEQHYKLNFHIASGTSLERAWARYKEISQATKSQAGLIDISDEMLTSYLASIKHIEDMRTEVQKTLETSKSHGVSKLLEIILAGAIAIDASDIHLEPEEKTARLRVRLDGVLSDIAELKLEAYKLILSRLKLISGLKLNIKSAAQDGRFSIHIGDLDIEIRTSVTPAAYGETVVLRVLNPKAIDIKFDELGIPERLSTLVDIEIKKPNGMVLVTGPTGSGKTTTLYAFLKKINVPGSKIITIEDPVEYHLSGISQTQVDAEKGYTFVEGLRAALRQDPDILMIGEIRDAETAGVAINSALTGHLVFSTLHTNNAAGAIPRLVDLEVNPKVISSAISVTLAQRLVRKLCMVCRQKSAPTEKELEILQVVIAEIAKKEPAITKVEITLSKPVGCPACNNTGYKGRIGVFEGIRMTSEVEKVLSGSVSEREITKAAEPQKLLSMREDGVVKVLSGVTSLEEIARVVDLYTLG